MFELLTSYLFVDAMSSLRLGISFGNTRRKKTIYNFLICKWYTCTGQFSDCFHLIHAMTNRTIYTDESEMIRQHGQQLPRNVSFIRFSINMRMYPYANWASEVDHEKSEVVANKCHEPHERISNSAHNPTHEWQTLYANVRLKKTIYDFFHRRQRHLSDDGGRRRRQVRSYYT